MKKILKSIGAIFAGLITIVVLSTVTDTVLENTGVFPPVSQQQEEGFYIWWMVLLAIIYRTLYGVLGSYIAAKLAPNRAMRHALILGVIGVGANVLGGIAMWDKTVPWYPISLTILSLPAAWVGGKLYEKFKKTK